MNLHAYSCEKNAREGEKCEQWCGNKHDCLSTLTYAQPWRQDAFEHGFRSALSAVEDELARMAQSTSPHRRLAARDLFYAIQDMRPVGGTVHAEDLSDDELHDCLTQADVATDKWAVERAVLKAFCAKNGIRVRANTRGSKS